MNRRRLSSRFNVVAGANERRLYSQARPLSIRYVSLALRIASRDECMSSRGISSMSLVV